MRSFSDVITALEALDLDGKTVSAQAFFKEEERLLKSGEIDLGAGIEDGTLSLSDAELDAFAQADQEDRDLVWINNDDAADLDDDRFLTRDGLVRYLKKTMHERGQVFLAEINAKLQAFQNCDDVADKVKSYEPLALSPLPTQAPKGKPIPVRRTQSEVPDNGRMTLAAFFNTVSRRHKIVSFEEFNRAAQSLAQFGPVDDYRYKISGHQALRSEKNARELFEELLITVRDPITGKDKTYLPARAMNYLVSSDNLDQNQATLIARSFDKCRDLAPWLARLTRGF